MKSQWHNGGIVTLTGCADAKNAFSSGASTSRGCAIHLQLHQHIRNSLEIDIVSVSFWASEKTVFTLVSAHSVAKENPNNAVDIPLLFIVDIIAQELS